MATKTREQIANELLVAKAEAYDAIINVDNASILRAAKIKEVNRIHDELVRSPLTPTVSNDPRPK